MKEYIEREAAETEIKTWGRREDEILRMRMMLDGIRSIPAADVVEVVRCRDCLLQRGCKPAQYLGDDGFCSHGERKGGDE